VGKICVGVKRFFAIVNLLCGDGGRRELKGGGGECVLCLWHKLAFIFIIIIRNHTEEEGETVKRGVNKYE
jgi:hypothetical protein